MVMLSLLLLASAIDPGTALSLALNARPAPNATSGRSQAVVRPSTPPTATATLPPLPSAALLSPATTAELAVPGREADARVARLAFRLADAGRARCPTVERGVGFLLQHLSQFPLAERAGMIAARSLDRGAGVAAVVTDAPGAQAGIRAGDVLVSVDGVPLPPEPALADPFDAARAHARADTVHALLTSGTAPLIQATLLRDGRAIAARIHTRPICASRVHLARSTQRNAFADGRRVLLTTGLLGDLHGDDELAFVIAHEMAHNILGHAAVLRGDKVARGIGRTFGRSGRVVRATERDADTLAGELMLDAGLDPVRGAQLLARLGDGDLFPEHAPAADRIAAMAALVQARRAGR